MVPHQQMIAEARMGFPRASGDGPGYSIATKSPGLFPPRERGWSLATAANLSEGRVSPARAGMVPDAASARPAWRRFPRASGDGPSLPCAFSALPLFPPRERGWSLHQVRPVLRQPVSPARAGMVPCSACGALPESRFPRASGDGPLTIGQFKELAAFPPRERGWSRRRFPA